MAFKDTVESKARVLRVIKCPVLVPIGVVGALVLGGDKLVRVLIFLVVDVNNIKLLTFDLYCIFILDRANKRVYQSDRERV